MTTPWVRSWDSTRVLLSSIRKSRVSSTISSDAGHSQRVVSSEVSTSAARVSRTARRNADPTVPSSPVSGLNRAAVLSAAAGRASSISRSTADSAPTSLATSGRRLTVKVSRQPLGSMSEALAVAGPEGPSAGGASAGE